ncbi:MAG TPA: 3'-5' exonuclease [Streptomyces sp.]|nr:3'-5' exonuclease [Streptomyces sp.]
MTVRSVQSAAPPEGRPDPELDRLSAAALVTQQAPHTPMDVRSWTVEAGVLPGPVIEALARALAAGAGSGRPLVVAHAPYDLTLLDRELRRHRHTPLAGYLGTRSLCVLDPVLLDRRLAATAAPAARRDLTQLCDGYGITPAPDAAAPPEDEAIAALALARALGRHFAPQLAGLTPRTLHTLQAIWYASGARGHAAWHTPCGAPGGVDPAWPLRPVVAA